MLKKYIENKYSHSYITTVGIDFQIKYLNINNKKIKLQIWDTAGEERYRIVAKNCFNSSDGFIIVYDITNRDSFNNVNNWIEQITDIAPSHSKCIIFGNKNDLEHMRQVELKEGKELAKKYNFNYYETSALNGKNINEGFESISKDILGDIKSVKAARKTTISLKDQKHKNKGNSSCC